MVGGGNYSELFLKIVNTVPGTQSRNTVRQGQSTRKTSLRARHPRRELAEIRIFEN